MRSRINARSLFARRGRDNGSLALLESLESRTLLTTIFGPMPQMSSGPGMTSQVVADFDGDGINDLAGLERVDAQNSILFFKGRGDGTFGAPVRTTLNVRVSAIGAGQFIPGGGMELVAVGGAGTPLSPLTGDRSRTTFVRVLELNARTGEMEVVIRGTVAAPAGGDSRASTPIVGDFTGDGVADIAFAPSSDTGRVVVLERAGSGLRLAATYMLPTPIGHDGLLSSGPIAADLNGDGRLDIISFRSDGYVALLNSSSGLATSAMRLDLSPDFDWKFADVDGDGKADAVSMWTPADQLASTSADRYTVVRVKKGLGAGMFGAMQTIGQVQIGGRNAGAADTTIDSQWLLVGQDIDHDGLGDIVYVRDYEAAGPTGRTVLERVVAITHNSDGTWNAPNFALGPNAQSGDRVVEILGGQNEIIADLNGDGRADLLDFGYRPIRGYLSSETVVVIVKPEIQGVAASKDVAGSPLDLRVGAGASSIRAFAFDLGGLLGDGDESARGHAAGLYGLDVSASSTSSRAVNATAQPDSAAIFERTALAGAASIGGNVARSSEPGRALDRGARQATSLAGVVGSGRQASGIAPGAIASDPAPQLVRTLQRVNGATRLAAFGSTIARDDAGTLVFANATLRSSVLMIGLDGHDENAVVTPGVVLVSDALRRSGDTMNASDAPRDVVARIAVPVERVNRRLWLNWRRYTPQEFAAKPLSKRRSVRATKAAGARSIQRTGRVLGKRVGVKNRRESADKSWQSTPDLVTAGV